MSRDHGKSHRPVVLTTEESAESRIEIGLAGGRVFHLGWDTEGGDCAAHNLLRAPIRLHLEFEYELTSLRRPADIFAVRVLTASSDEVVYRFQPLGHLGVLPELDWAIRLTEDGLSMRLASVGMPEKKERIAGLRLVFPFDLQMCSTTVIGGSWTDDGHPVLPLLISAPDQGTMRLECAECPDLVGVWRASRYWEGERRGARFLREADLTLDLPAPDPSGCELTFRPVHAEAPPELEDGKRWSAARRGWWNLIQVHGECGHNKGERESPGGLWANNTISNPVSSLLWMLGEHLLLIPRLAEGISLAPLVSRTIDYWLNDEIGSDGRVFYVENGLDHFKVMDSNPAVLSAAWCYVEATGDAEWLRDRLERLEFVAGFMEGRDVDGDGLIESPQSGNSWTHVRPDQAWDTICAGHKNAYINALAYRAFRCLADLERRLDRKEKADHYDDLADRLKAIYRDTFFNPETGWLGWWQSEDGMLHDVHSDVPTDVAAIYGLIAPDDGKRMLDAWWQELQQTGFDRFDLGVPVTLRPVPKADQLAWDENERRPYYVPREEADAEKVFGRWLNGGCCVANTYWSLLANYVVGNGERADMILDAMLKRQAEGTAFPNGGGFQNGVADQLPFGAEFFEWDGKPSGYEGHLVYSWAFLQCIFLRHESFRRRVLGPVALS
jgi:hypothetical protein